MRAALLASAISIGAVSASMAFPVALQPAAPELVRIHGCHHTYRHDVTGWHRHDQACRTLRTIVARKKRPMGNT
jgi:hypothetical protein